MSYSSLRPRWSIVCRRLHCPPWWNWGQVQLVVLATCDALVTAVEVAQTANMISTDAEITGVEAERWAKCFYEFLGNGIPLFQAFALTKTQVEDVPMRIIRKQDVVFRKIAPSG